MRSIEILDDLRLRFPGRDAEFDTGLEVGAVSVLIAQGYPFIRRELSQAAIEQLRPIAEHFRYAVAMVDAGAGSTCVSFTQRSRKPDLRVVQV